MPLTRCNHPPTCFPMAFERAMWTPISRCVSLPLVSSQSRHCFPARRQYWEENLSVGSPRCLDWAVQSWTNRLTQKAKQLPPIIGSILMPQPTWPPPPLPLPLLSSSGSILRNYLANQVDLETTWPAARESFPAFIPILLTHTISCGWPNCCSSATCDVCSHKTDRRACPSVACYFVATSVRRRILAIPADTFRRAPEILNTYPVGFNSKRLLLLLLLLLLLPLLKIGSDA